MEKGPNLEKSPYYKWLVTIAVMSGATLVVLDITIVNVALPQIMASFGVTVDKIQWVLIKHFSSSALWYSPYRQPFPAWHGTRTRSLSSGLSRELVLAP
jgi:hypothetical protein